MTSTIVRVMALSVDDFLRLLPALAGIPDAPVPARNQIAFFAEGITLCWRTLPPVQSGAMQLPQLEVTLRFDDMQSKASIDFLQRFDRTYQRGGG